MTDDLDDLEDCLMVTEKTATIYGIPYLASVAEQAAMTDEEINAECKRLVEEEGKVFSEELFLSIVLDKYKKCLKLTLN